jgi:hypothetical protein
MPGEGRGGLKNTGLCPNVCVSSQGKEGDVKYENVGFESQYDARSKRKSCYPEMEITKLGYRFSRDFEIHTLWYEFLS